MVDSDTQSLDKIFMLLSYGFPSAVFLCLCNAGLSDNVFWIVGAVGKRILPEFLRRAAGHVFSCVTASIGMFASLWVLRSCHVNETFCSDNRLDGDSNCVKASVLSLVLVLICTIGDRVWLPLVGIKNDRMRRVSDSFGIALAWILLSEQDPIATLTIVVLNIRRVRFLQSRVSLWLGRVARVGLLSTCMLAMGGRCTEVSPKNAAGGLLLSIIT